MESTILTETNCLHCPDKSCFNAVAVQALQDEITKSQSLLGEDSELDAVVLEDVAIYKKALESTCEDCAQKSSEASTININSRPVSDRKKDVVRVWTTAELEKWAWDHQFEVIESGGRHPKKIMAQNGESRPLPTHPGDLNRFTTGGIMKWMYAVLEGEKQQSAA